jgi:hypothetical protein
MEGRHQRVLNDLWRTRLSRRRMIWLLPHLLPHLRQQVFPLFQSSCVSPLELTDGIGGRGWKGVGEEPKSYDDEKA